MKEVWKWLEGKKSNITALAIAVNTFLLGRGYIEKDVAVLIYGLLAGLGLYAVRDGIKKMER